MKNTKHKLELTESALLEALSKMLSAIPTPDPYFEQTVVECFFKHFGYQIGDWWRHRDNWVILVEEMPNTYVGKVKPAQGERRYKSLNNRCYEINANGKRGCVVRNISEETRHDHRKRRKLRRS